MTNLLYLFICTEPQITSTLQEGDATSSTAVQVTYTEEACSECVFDKYVFNIDGVASHEKTKEDLDREVLFSDLEPGHTYTVTAHTVSGEEESDKKNIQITTSERSDFLYRS